jgi:hypothetical protein
MNWLKHRLQAAWPFSLLRKAPTANPLDPYAVWASVTGFRGFTANQQFQRTPGDTWVSFIAELTSVADLDAMLADMPPQRRGRAAHPASWLYVPEAYRDTQQRTRAGLQASTFITGRVTVRNLHRLSTLTCIKRWELGLPSLAPREAGEPQGGLTARGLPENTLDDRQSAAPILETKGDDGSPDDASLRQRGVISVIDFGAAVFNQAFVDARLESRVAFLWDQHQRAGARNKDVWTASYGFGYGRVLTHARVQTIRGMPPNPDEELLYRRVRYLQERAQRNRPLKRAVHGTHVLDVAGGRHNPWHRVDSRIARLDEASDAWLHFVHLPIETAVDSSGGSLAVHVLDGVRDALLRCPPDTPLVIVLSQGTHAGPHDGSSILECAFDELLALRPTNFTIVIGAGNGRFAQDDESIGCHASGRVTRGRNGRFRIHVPEGDTTETFVEFWSHDRPAKEALQFRIVPPSPLPPSPWTGADPCVSGVDMGSVCCSLIQTNHTPGGKGRMALLALSPTLADGAGRVPPGEWVVEVRTDSLQETEIQAWVERDEPLRNAAFDWPRFIGAGVTNEGTVNTVATGRFPIIAGAMRFNNGQESPYSAHGPLYGERAGAKAPAVLVASDESAARPGLRAAAVRSHDTHRMSGTSVSAPTLARLLFNEMQQMCQAGRSVGRKDWATLLAKLCRDQSKPRLVAGILRPGHAGRVKTRRGQANATPPAPQPGPRQHNPRS